MSDTEATWSGCPMDTMPICPPVQEYRAWNGPQVAVHLYSQSEPIVIRDVVNTYQKGDMYCVMQGPTRVVYKFPLQHIFRVTEELADGRN